MGHILGRKPAPFIFRDGAGYPSHLVMGVRRCAVKPRFA